MTFTEAAAEVLRLVGRPLHYKKITEIAVQRNLLWHVGKSPEITMSSRLATLLKKDRGESPIVKVKPGVFGLRTFSKEVLAKGDPDESEIDALLAARDAAAAEKNMASASEPPKSESTEPRDPESSAQAPETPAAPPKPRVALPGQEVFPEEADDDEPILGRADAPEASGEGEGDDGERRGKKRRRKKRRGDEPDAPRDEERGQAPGRRDTERRDRDRERDRDRDRDRNRDRDRDRPRHDRREPELRGDFQREPAEGDALGRDLADAIEGCLDVRQGRGRSYSEIAESLVQRGRLQGDAHALAPTVAAAVRGDAARKASRGEKPRFRIRFGEVTHVDALGTPELAKAEQEAMRAMARHREMVQRALVRKLSELPNSALLEVIATFLNAQGVTSLRGVRKPGALPGEFHLAGVLRRGPEETPLAIVVVREGTVGRERIVDVRGSLHRYGDARAAWFLVLGHVHGSARDEAAEAGAAPVALFDAERLGRALEEAGIGVRRYSVPLVALDHDLFDELRGPGAPPRAPREERPSRDDGRRRDEPREDEAEVAEEGAEDEVAEGTPERAGEGEAAGRRKRRRRRRRRGGADVQPGTPDAERDDDASAAPDAEDERADAVADDDVDREDVPDADEDIDDDRDDDREDDREDDRDDDREDDRDDDRDDDGDDDDLDDDDREPDDEREDEVEDSTEVDLDDDLDDDR